MTDHNRDGRGAAEQLRRAERARRQEIARSSGPALSAVHRALALCSFSRRWRGRAGRLLAARGSGGVRRDPRRSDHPPPDRRGNNRADSLTNVLENPHVGMLFLIPGADETLRLNGRATLTTDPTRLEPLAVKGRVPRSGLLVEVEEVFLQCTKALVRSRLWADESRVDRKAVLPSFGQMLADHIGESTARRSIASFARRSARLSTDRARMTSRRPPGAQGTARSRRADRGGRPGPASRIHGTCRAPWRGTPRRPWRRRYAPDKTLELAPGAAEEAQAPL